MKNLLFGLMLLLSTVGMAQPQEFPFDIEVIGDATIDDNLILPGTTIGNLVSDTLILVLNPVSKRVYFINKSTLFSGGGASHWDTLNFRIFNNYDDKDYTVWVKDSLLVDGPARFNNYIWLGDQVNEPRFYFLGQDGVDQAYIALDINDYIKFENAHRYDFDNAVAFRSMRKVYWDGGVNTYTYEAANDWMQWWIGNKKLFEIWEGWLSHDRVNFFTDTLYNSGATRLNGTLRVEEIATFHNDITLTSNALNFSTPTIYFQNTQDLEDGFAMKKSNGTSFSLYYGSRIGVTVGSVGLTMSNTGLLTIYNSGVIADGEDDLVDGDEIFDYIDGLIGGGVSITNAGDDRVLTSSGGTAINGEVNMTFDGTLLILNALSTFGDNMSIDDNAGDSPILYFIDGNDDYFSIHKGDIGHTDLVNSEGAINFKTNGDLDDFLSISTTGGVVTIQTVKSGNGDLVITTGGTNITLNGTLLFNGGTVTLDNGAIFDNTSSAIALTITETNINLNGYASLFGAGQIAISGLIIPGSDSLVDAQTIYDFITVNVLAYSSNNINLPPSIQEITAAFGTPPNAGAGFKGLMDNSGAGEDVYIVASDGSNWWHIPVIKAVSD